MAMAFELTVALLFLLVGSGLLVWTVWNVISALDSRRWPEAPGTIVVSDLQRSKGGDGGVSYRPEVTYRYVVDGRELIASRTRFGDRIELSWSAPAVRAVRKFPVGANVAVRYNPNHPQEAVLEPGIYPSLWVTLVIACGFTAVGILALRSAL